MRCFVLLPCTLAHRLDSMRAETQPFVHVSVAWAMGVQTYGSNRKVGNTAPFGSAWQLTNVNFQTFFLIQDVGILCGLWIHLWMEERKYEAEIELFWSQPINATCLMVCFDWNEWSFLTFILRTVPTSWCNPGLILISTICQQSFAEQPPHLIYFNFVGCWLSSMLLITCS